MELVKCYFDIEVLLKDEFPDETKAEEPIVAISAYINTHKKYYTWFYKDTMENKKVEIENWVLRFFNSEEKMLSDFLNFIYNSGVDILLAWNISFDFEYIRNRCRKFYPELFGLFKKIEYTTQVFDLLKRYKRVKRLSSYSLAHVAEKEGITKKTEKASDIPYLYENDIHRLLIYNLTDVKIIKELDEKSSLKLSEKAWQMKSYVGAPEARDVFFFSNLLDILFLRFAKHLKIVLPSRHVVNEEDEEDESYEGAIVFEPTVSKAEMVSVFDMKMFYPSIILSLDLSIEEIDTKTKIVPLVVRYLIDQRKMYEKEMEKYTPGTPEYEDAANNRQVVKELLNAVYGYLAYQRSRTFKKELAETITDTARKGLMWVRDRINELGYEVIYGDTDSVFVKTGLTDLDEIISECNKIADYVNASFDTFAKEVLGIDKHYFKLEFEKVFKKVIFFEVKKRYAGRVIWEKGKRTDYPLIKGLETERTDQSPITKTLQHDIIEMILHDEPREEIIDHVRSIINKIRSGQFSVYDFGISKGINKNLKLYEGKKKGIPQHIKAALYSNKYLGTNFKKGDKIKILYVKAVNGLPRTDVIAFTDDMRLPDGIVIDYDKFIKTMIRSKIEKILQVEGIYWEQIMGTKTLSNFSAK